MTKCKVCGEYFPLSDLDAGSVYEIYSVCSKECAKIIEEELMTKSKSKMRRLKIMKKCDKGDS